MPTKKERLFKSSFGKSTKRVAKVVRTFPVRVPEMVTMPSNVRRIVVIDISGAVLIRGKTSFAD